MKRIVAIGASSSSNSINKKFASYAANLVSLKKDVIELDLRQYEMPIYSEDLQNVSGIPKKAFDFKIEISNSDALVISLAEHNGSYTAAFKNIYDWISVIEADVWCSKPILLLSTSTGARGGKTVLDTAHSRFSRNYKFKIPFFSLPNFFGRPGTRKKRLQSPARPASPSIMEFKIWKPSNFDRFLWIFRICYQL